MSKTLTKKELRAPDSFQEIAGLGADWIEKNIHLILVVVALVIIGALGWIGYGFYNRYAETQAEKALYPAEQAALKSISQATDKGALDLKDYLDVLKSHAGMKTSATSAIQVIAALNSKDHTESIQKQVMTATNFHPSEDHFLYGIWNLTEGQVLTRNGEFAAAKKSFQNVLEAKEQSEFHPMALIQLGSLAEKEGDLKGARDFYLRVTREFPDSEAKGIAEKLLIHLDLAGEKVEQNS